MKKTKQPIIEVASELFSKSGYVSVSMDSIAKRLNITKPALYYHFKDKKELYLKAVESSFEKTMKELKANNRSIFSLSNSYFQAGMKKSSFLGIVSRDRGDLSVSNHLASLKEKIVSTFDKSLQNRNKATLLVGAIDGLVINSELSGNKRGAKRQIKKIVSMITKVDD